MQLKIPRGQCRSCGAPISCFVLRCPRCQTTNQPNPAATVAALAGGLVIGGAIALGGYISLRKPAEQAASARTEPPPSLEGGAESGAEFNWLVKAMAECDNQAKQKPGTLHFLIVPVVPTGLSSQGWSPDPIADVGNLGKLLSSSDALIGLRNHAIIIYQKPMTFQVADPKTNAVYAWKPEVGVAALNAARSGFDSIKLGFGMPDNGDAVEWSPVINIKKDMCYWINVLVLTPGQK